jgi:hypothetical protein
MRDSLRMTAAFAALLLLTQVADHAHAATILSSGDNTQNFSSTNHIVIGPAGGASVLVTQDVGHSPSFGPWRKFLINGATDPSASPPHSISSGVDVGMLETMTNLGGAAWNQWTEKVFTRTTIATTNDAPGFQFKNGSLLVEANYGAGFIVLTQGVHYTAVATPAPGIGFDPNGSEAFKINFQPGFEIDTGDKLRLSANIFEVFGDGDVWQQGLAAGIDAFPGVVPEPAAMSMIALAATMLLRRRCSSARSGASIRAIRA